ncbi:MAG: hypothetical protein ACLTFJ_07370 [Clostridium sp.]
MKKPTAEVYDILDEIEETLKGLYVAVLVADAEPDSITSGNMTAYMHMLSLIVTMLIEDVGTIKEMITEE